jgi:hypothetical protein
MILTSDAPFHDGGLQPITRLLALAGMIVLPIFPRA